MEAGGRVPGRSEDAVPRGARPRLERFAQLRDHPVSRELPGRAGRKAAAQVRRSAQLDRSADGRAVAAVRREARQSPLTAGTAAKSAASAQTSPSQAPIWGALSNSTMLLPSARDR